MTKSNFCFTFLFTISFYGNCQLVDDTTQAHHRHHENEFIIKLENRSTHINSEFTTIYGLAVGLDIHHKFRVKLSGNSTFWDVGLWNRSKFYFSRYNPTKRCKSNHPEAVMSHTRGNGLCIDPLVSPPPHKKSLDKDPLRN